MISVELPAHLHTSDHTEMVFDASLVKIWPMLTEEVAAWCREHLRGDTLLRPMPIWQDGERYFPMQTDPEDGVSEVQGMMFRVGAEMIFANDTDAVHFRMKWMSS